VIKWENPREQSQKKASHVHAEAARNGKIAAVNSPLDNRA